MVHPAPIFILAPPRSFTSVICGVLGQHPDIFGVPELNLFRAETIKEYLSGRPKQKKKGKGSPFRFVRHDGTLRTVAQLYAGEQTLDSVELAYRWLHVRSQRSTASVFRELCEKVNPLALLDKSPGYVRRRAYMDRIWDTFPQARFIHLLRHPRGVCESIMTAQSGPISALFVGAVDDEGEAPVIDPQGGWVDAHVNIMGFLGKIPQHQWMRVRGEDFLQNIELRAAEICRWLGIDDSAGALEAMKYPERSPFACIGPGTARLGGDPNFLEAPQLRPYRAKTLSLEGALSWRPDGRGFNPDVKALARSFGYS
jgi:hypothetical protein